MNIQTISRLSSRVKPVRSSTILSFAEISRDLPDITATVTVTVTVMGA